MTALGTCSRRGSYRPRPAGSLRALVLANARYWPTVAPAARRELEHWRRLALRIPEASLRKLALEKLAGEGFNAELAATHVTLAPGVHRASGVRAVIALELLFDYLDGRTEQTLRDPLADGFALFESLTAAVDLAASGQSSTIEANADAPDSLYRSSLATCTRDNLAALPGSAQLAPIAETCVKRCAQAQVRMHAAAALGDRQLQAWAEEHSRSSGLQWREYTAGCASSVLSLHALIAAAADPAFTIAEATRIDSAYLAIGALITMLDSLVDHAEDTARGEPGFIRLYEGPEELTDALRLATREALARAREAPHPDHHTMTIAGVAAYYLTHPGAREPQTRKIARVVRAELTPAIWATLGLMATWRVAKSTRGTFAVARTPRART